MAPTAYATRRGLPSHRRLDAVLLDVHEIRRHAAVLALRAGEEHRGTRLQQTLVSRNRRQDRHVRADAVFRLAILEFDMHDLALRGFGHGADRGVCHDAVRAEIPCSLPSVPFTPVEARKSPALMSARDFLTRLWILVASVTATFTSIPSRALTVKFAPSTFSIVPRTRTGGAAGGFCASAGSAKSMTTAAATDDFRSIPPSPFRGAPTGATAAGICPARQLAQLKGERFDDSSIRRPIMNMSAITARSRMRDLNSELGGSAHFAEPS